MKKFLCSELGMIVVPAVLFIIVYAILDAFTDLGRLIRVAIAGVVWFVAFLVMIKTLKSAKKNDNT